MNEQDELDVALIAASDVAARYDEYLMSSVAPDPYPTFAELRKTDPVYKGDIMVDAFGMPPSWGSAGGSRPMYSIFRYDDVVSVLRDPKTFSNTVWQESIGQSYDGLNLVMVDPPDHQRLRSPVQAAFNKPQVGRWQETLIRPIVAEYISSFVDDGHADLMTQMALTLPSALIHRLLGLPAAQLDEFRTYGIGLLTFEFMPEVSAACSRQASRLVSDVVAQRRVEPRDDLISYCLQARDKDGNGFSEPELRSFLNLQLVAGSDTSVRGLGSLIVGLLRNPDQLDYLRGHRDAIPAAVEEALRWETPTVFIFRTVLADTEIGGVKIPAGSGINVCLGSANRDESHYPEPDRFDLHRMQGRASAIMSFAWGIHLCLGIHVARSELAATADGLLNALPNLRLDPTKPPPEFQGTTFRNVPSIPATWG